MVKYWDVFLIKGLSITISLSIIAVFFGAILGALLALGKMSRFKILRGIITAFIEVIRGTPILLQLYLFYFILPMALPALNIE
ncbi:MAG: ABC transporter permease subunit, partial [Clostridia bacterium]|nr:ABC transporter permease subunit [Clostridia bacterium]